MSKGKRKFLSRKRRPAVFMASALAVLAVGLGLWALWRQSTPPPRESTAISKLSPRADQFVGSEACAKCHEREYTAWRASTHRQAGGSPKETKLIARFDGQPLRFKDATVVPTRRQDGSPVFLVEEQTGDRFEVAVDAVVGGGHLLGGGTQSFFQKFPDGTMRFLPFDFIRQENQWFVQLRRDLTWAPVTPELSLYTDLANWPPRRVLGTPLGMSNCQNCHGSQIAVAYNEAQRRYETHFQSLQINCESCHGPGQRHLEIVGQPGFEGLEDIGMAPLSTLSKDESLRVCFQCHATKTVLNERPYLPGERLEDYFSLLLPLFTEEPFTEDGRVKSFDYQSNHLFSDCYLNGSMTCVDCHDPHSQQYRDVFGRPLVGRFDNRQCTSCHASKADSTRHSHHKPDSPGNQCTACHMPYLQHQGVGQHFTFARSDHSIPIPRPAFDHQLGIENACQKCHSERDIGWQEARIREWYGDLKPHHALVTGLLRSRDLVDPDFARELLLAPEARHPMAQMRGLGTFIRRFIRPGRSVSDPEVINHLRGFATGENLDLMALGLMGLHVGYSDQPQVQTFLEERLAALGTNAPAVRARWALAADELGQGLAQANDLPAAIACLLKSLEVQPDNAVTLSHLALAYGRAGAVERAVTTMQKAISLRPAMAPLYFQLAQMQAQFGQPAEALRTVEQGLRYAPDDEMAKLLLEKLRASF